LLDLLVIDTPASSANTLSRAMLTASLSGEADTASVAFARSKLFDIDA
jgi:hypothetical protein